MEIVGVGLAMQKCLITYTAGWGRGETGGTGKGGSICKAPVLEFAVGPSLLLALLVQRRLSVNIVDLEFNLNGGHFCFFKKFSIESMSCSSKNTLDQKQGLKCT